MKYMICMRSHHKIKNYFDAELSKTVPSSDLLKNTNTHKVQLISIRPFGRSTMYIKDIHFSNQAF